MSLNTAWIIPLVIGTALGILSGLGTGGGSLLALYLTGPGGLDSGTARGICLMCYLPSAAISLFFRRRQGAVPREIVLPAIPAACAGSLAGMYLAAVTEAGSLRQLFGLFLLAAGVRELFYRPRELR